MHSKPLIWIGLLLGSTIGAYVPALWDAGLFSLSSTLLGGIGGILGIWLGWKLSDY